MHFQKGAHSNVCPNIVPKICLTHLAEIIDASVWLLTRKGSVNSFQHGHHQAQVAIIQKIRACIIIRFLRISQMSACYQAQIVKSSNYLLSRFVFDHLWGIPGEIDRLLKTHKHKSFFFFLSRLKASLFRSPPPPKKFGKVDLQLFG